MATMNISLDDWMYTQIMAAKPKGKSRSEWVRQLVMERVMQLPAQSGVPVVEPSGKASTAGALRSDMRAPKKEVSPSKGKKMGPPRFEPMDLVTVVIGRQESASVSMDWDTSYAGEDTVLDLELGSGFRATSGVFSSFTEIEPSFTEVFS